jgi:sulfate permease, SulP family
MLKPYLPFLEWGRAYQWRYLPDDITAGLTVATMLVPQSLAYATLAGLPPIMGLYTSLLPVFLYGLLGSTPVLTLGPTAITSVMIFATLQPLAETESEEYIALAITMALFLGLIYLAAGLLRLGWIINLLSRPVLLGYVNAAALIIAFSQVQHLLGIETPNSSYPHELVLHPLLHLDEVNIATLILALAGIGVIVFFRTRVEKLLRAIIPRATLRLYIVRSAPLVIIFLSIIVVAVLRLDTSYDVEIIGDIPSGLPQAISPTDLTFSHSPQLMIGAAAIAFVGFMEGISTANAFAAQQRRRVDTNQELIAMGVANIASALSGGHAGTTSISRSAVNYAAGARSGISSMVASFVILLTVLVLTPLFYFLPRVTLSIIILTGIVNLIDFSVVSKIWRYSRSETTAFFVTFIGVFVAGIEVGIFGGIIASYLLHLARTSRPHIAILGRVGNSQTYVDIRSNPSARLMQRTLIIRIDESLYFGNIRYFESFVRNAIAEYPQTEYIVLACDSVNRIDGTALEHLRDLITELDAARLRVLFAGLKPQVFVRLRPIQFEQEIGEERFFPAIHDAIRETEPHPDLLLEEYHI